ncbi:MFS transporter [Psychrobacillus soli]|uniref:MFS transporter n=1 Tax=Psychrobacillus soli TaxID=1543965 RepID=A0A544T9U0_9BACI|nr:MFS transporter [Psychrobacillus soli]
MESRFCCYQGEGGLSLIFLRPDPLLVATAIANVQEKDGAKQAGSNLEGSTINKKGIALGATIMILTQFVMVAIMTMTPIHMGNHGHSLREVGLVIGFHVGAMYFPLLFTGALVDKIGRSAMAVAAGITLLTSGIVAAFALLITALVLLGIGWNLGLISGTALIVDATHPSVRAKTQGSVDVLLALSGASGSALSGMVVAHSSYAMLSISGAILSLLLISVIFVWTRENKSKKEK